MKEIFYFLSLSCFLLVSGVTHGQEWTRTNGPFGGETNIVVSTAGLTVAQTHHGLYRSSFSNVWSKVSSVPWFNGMVTLNNVIFAVGNKDGVNGCFRSNDGVTWSIVRSFAGENFYMIRASNPYLILISQAGSTYKMYFSHDLGQTWISRDLPAGGHIVSAGISQNQIAVATIARLVFYSDNYGASWRGLNFPAPSTINSIELHQSSIVVGTNTVHVSRDRGQTWIQKPEAGYGYKVFNCEGILYVSNWRTGLKRSFDGGQTWEDVPALNFSVNSVALNVNTGNTYFGTSAGVFRSPDYGRQVTEMTTMMSSHNYFPSGANLSSDGTNLFVATVSGGVFKSSDAGASWISLRNGLSGMQLFNKTVLINNGRLFTAPISHPLLSSDDLGLTWTTHSGTNFETTAFLSSGNTILAGGIKSYGPVIFRSDDNGTTWFRSEDGFPTTTSFTLVTSLTQASGAVYAAHTEGVYKSTDFGRSWSLLALSPKDGNVIFGSGNFVYLITGYNSLYRSADGGATFIKMPVAGNPLMYCFAQHQGILFMGTTRGVLYSSDNGSTWNSYGLVNQAVSSLVVMGQNLYASINGSEVMKTPLLINSITFDPIPSKVYGDEPFALQASTNSGLPITFSSDNPAAIIQGNVVTIRGTGSVTITASIQDNLNTSAQQTLIIEKAPLVAKANDASWQYGSPAQPFSISYSGFVYDDTEDKITPPTIAVEPADTVNAGQYELSLTGGSAANYNIATQPGTLTITRAPLQAIANNASMIYGDNVPPLSITYNGFIGTDDVTFLDETPGAVAAIPLPVISKEATNVEEQATPATKPDDGSMQEAVDQRGFPDAGQYAINVSGGTDNNYEIIPVSGVLTIDKAPLVVVAEDKSRVYGDENPPFTFLYEGFKGTDNATMIDQHPVASTNAGLFSDAGEEYQITVEGGIDRNYELFYQSGTFTIVPAPIMIYIADQVIEYGVEVPLEARSSIYDITGLKGVDGLESMDTPIEISIHEPRMAEGTQFINAGSYALVMTQGADKNYLLDFSSAILTVTKADLHARALHINKIYGDPNPALSIEFLGFKGTETESLIDQFPTMATTADIMSPVGQYPIVLSGGSDDNYSIIIGEDGVLEVNYAILSVFAENKFKTYGDATSDPLTIRYEGFKGTDDESVIDQAPSVSTTVSATSNAGEYAITLEGGYDDNYLLSFFNGTYTVNKAKLLATAVPMETMYGDIFPKPWPITYSGLVGTDDISSIDLLPQAGPKVSIDAMEIKDVPNAGKYLVGVGGGGDNNYEIIPVHGTLVINKAPLYVDFVPVESFYGDIVPKIVLQYHSFKASEGFKIGPVNLEKIPLVSLATKPIDAGTYPVTISGGSDNNYYFEYFKEGYVLIKPAPLKIWIEPQTIEYGNDAQIAFDWKYDRFKGTEDASVLDSPPVGAVYETANPDGSQFRPAGIHEIVLTGGGDNNYAFDYVTSFVHINKAPLIARPVSAARHYGDPNPEFGIDYIGLKGSETASVIDEPPLASTTAQLSSPVGNYPVSLSGGLDNNYNLFFEDGSLEISRANLIVRADDRSKMYGQEFYTSLSILYDGFKGTDDASVLDVQPTVSTIVTGTSDAGTYPIIVEGGSDHNYTFTYVNGVFTVNKVMLTAKADDKTKVYGEENPEFTITYTGFVNGEDKTVIDMPPNVINPPDVLSAPGTYPITFDGGSDINYDFDHVPGILTITELTTPVAGKPTATCYLTSPANNATNVNYYVALTANFVIGARVYTMEVNTSNDFSGTSIVKQGGQNIPFLLDHDTRYYVRIQTDQAPDVWSVVSTFTTGNPLTLAYVNSPGDGATSVPTNVKVTANNLYGATRYMIELNTLSDFTGTSFVENSDGRSITFKKLEQATTYFARVTTDLIPGQWGPVTSFTTLDPRARTKAWQEGEESDFETEGISYHVYPNPFKEKVSILVQSLEQVPFELSLFDMNGRMVEGKTGSTNNLLELGESVSHGVYLLKVVSGDKTKFIRLIKHQ